MQDKTTARLHQRQHQAQTAEAGAQDGFHAVEWTTLITHIHTPDPITITGG